MIALALSSVALLVALAALAIGGRREVYLDPKDLQSIVAEEVSKQLTAPSRDAVRDRVVADFRRRRQPAPGQFN